MSFEIFSPWNLSLLLAKSLFKIMHYHRYIFVPTLKSRQNKGELLRRAVLASFWSFLLRYFLHFVRFSLSLEKFLSFTWSNWDDAFKLLRRFLFDAGFLVCMDRDLMFSFKSEEKYSYHANKVCVDIQKIR